MCEAYVHVFGHSNVSSWPVLVYQSECFNLFALVLAVLFCFFFISIAVLAAMFCFCVVLAVLFRFACCLFRFSSYFGGSTIATIFLRL